METSRKQMLRTLARKNAALGAVQIGSLSSKQLAIDQAQWRATEALAQRQATREEKSPESPMATFCAVV